MELHRLRASQVSAAQPLKIIYHRKRRLSNGFLVVIVVYALQIKIILALKVIVSPQETYSYTQSPSPASSTVHKDYLDTDRSSSYSHYLYP